LKCPQMITERAKLTFYETIKGSSKMLKRYYAETWDI